MAKTKFFRVAVEGATTDGRVIERQWIEEMAASYNPATYTARINCEHLRGFSPDAPFNAYGSVVALKAEEIELELDGKKQKRLALFAQLDANDQLLAVNKAGQKLFTSIEVNPKFAGTDKAYLVGFAITDNPASLGTEALSFAALKPMFDARKSHPANLFTASVEAAIELEETAEDPSVSGIAEFKSWLAGLFSQQKAPEPAKPVEEPRPANDNFAALFAEGMGKLTAAIEAQASKSAGDVEALRTEFGTLKTQLETTDAGGFTRKPATGGGQFTATDC